MRESAGLFPLNSHKPPVQLLVSLVIISGVALISFVFILVSAKLIFGIGINSIDLERELLTDIEIKFLRYIQAIQHFSLFLLPSLIISLLMTGSIINYLGLRHRPGYIVLLAVILASVSILPITSALGVLNSGFELPEWFPKISDWIIRKDEQAGRLTGWLIKADNTGGLLINIIVLSLLPAFGEEFMFRGIIQNIFTKWFRSSNLAIWITAILFSIVHFQFFGFLPRILLGLFFGYLYHWSSSIWLPVLAHFINNLVPVLGAYFMGWEEMNNRIAERGLDKGWLILIPFLMVILFMNLIRSAYKTKTGN